MGGQNVETVSTVQIERRSSQGGHRFIIAGWTITGWLLHNLFRFILTPNCSATTVVNSLNYARKYFDNTYKRSKKTFILSSDYCTGLLKIWTGPSSFSKKVQFQVDLVNLANLTIVVPTWPLCRGTRPIKDKNRVFDL